MVQDTSEIKEKIILVFKKRGPSLPVHVAKETGLNILFASAFLSELLNEKKIKISNMRVGNSPIYFVSGQEIMLEKFSEYLKSKEKEAFLLLRQKKFLKDSEQEPAIRVALRAIKDFALPFKKNEEIYWRYFIVPEMELKELKIKTKKPTKRKSEISMFPEGKSKPEILISPEVKSKSEISISPEVKSKSEISMFPEGKSKEKQSDLKILEKPKTLNKKIKEKSDFTIKILNFLKIKDIELIEEIESKKKEFLGIAKIKTSLGSLEILIIAKDKKKITKNDIELALQKNNVYKRIVLFVSTGEINKKTKEFLNDYKNIIKFLNIQI